MAKKKTEENMETTTTETVVESKPKPSVSPFMAKMLETSAKHFGDKNIHVGTKQRIVGLELYSLALQWLIDLQVLPFQSIVAVAGEPKSYKTSSLIEFARMFLRPMEADIPDSKWEPGVASIVHTEGKWSPSKVTSMLGELSDQLLVVNHKVSNP